MLEFGAVREDPQSDQLPFKLDSSDESLCVSGVSRRAALMEEQRAAPSLPLIQARRDASPTPAAVTQEDSGGGALLRVQS